MTVRPLIVLLFLFGLFSFELKTDSIIDKNNIDENKLEALILEKVNALRKTNRRKELTKNSLLGLAAQDHADYLKKKKRLSHKQSTPKKRSPMDRADFYGGKFNYVGENVAFTYINESVVGTKNKRKSRVLRTYEETAQYLFELWKYSKPHYVNMIDKDYRMTSIRFSFDAKSNRIYAVQVFGSF